MSTEYLSSPNIPSQPPKKDNRVVILLSVILALLIVIIAAVVVAFTIRAKSNDGEITTTESTAEASVEDEQMTTPRFVADTSETDESSHNEIEKSCPVCKSTKFTGPDADGRYNCKDCDSEWKENGDRVIIYQDGQQTEMANVVSTTVTTTITTRTTTTTKPTTSKVTTVTTKTSVSDEEYHTGTYVLNIDQALKEKPRTDSRILTTIPWRTYIYVDKVQNGWGHTTYEGVEGWIKL